MLQQGGPEDLPTPCIKTEEVEKSCLGATGRMTACKQVTGDLALLDDAEMSVGQSRDR
jgi:hypothetical protein